MVGFIVPLVDDHKYFSNVFQVAQKCRQSHIFNNLW